MGYSIFSQKGIALSKTIVMEKIFLDIYPMHEYQYTLFLFFCKLTKYLSSTEEFHFPHEGIPHCNDVTQGVIGKSTIRGISKFVF